MTQNIITFLILILCAFFIGRRYYRQWRAAVNPKQDLSCSSGCEGCNVGTCEEKDRK